MRNPFKKKSAADLAGQSLDRLMWRRFRRNPLSVISLAVIGLFALVAVLGYLITPDPTPYCNQQYLELATLKPGSRATFLCTTDNFETRTTIYEKKSMPANNPQYVEAKPVLTVKEGQELLVRVYPWYNGAASGKTICLSDLTIHGMAVSATGISQVSTDSTTTTAFFTVDGRQHAQMQRGLNIVRMSDGSIKKLIY